MFKKFLKVFLPLVLGYGFAFAIFGIWFVGILSPYLLGVIIAVFVVLVSYHTAKEFSKKELDEVNAKLQEALQTKELAQKEEKLWQSALRERASGFPTLFNAIEEYYKARDEKLASFLTYKKHPAVKASEVVREEARRRREAEFIYKKTQAIIDYYENIAPFLIDLKGEIIDLKEEDVFKEFTEEERQDPVTHYLTKEEYRKLPTTVKNQMALDRFWKRPKSKWLLGRLYERYVGYLYEQKGYDVEYVGIFKGYEDLGRDLICRKGNGFIVIQCKNWSQFKTIYEKHIFQFFGTVFQYKDENPHKKVGAIFYTTTRLSDLARRFANELGIELKEGFRFDQTYPSIKCNVSRIDGEKIYHLPFDQQYDNTKVEIQRGEFYCTTVKEAEADGFRRAFRWRGDKEPTSR